MPENVEELSRSSPPDDSDWTVVESGGDEQLWAAEVNSALKSLYLDLSADPSQVHAAVLRSVACISVRADGDAAADPAEVQDGNSASGSFNVVDQDPNGSSASGSFNGRRHVSASR